MRMTRANAEGFAAQLLAWLTEDHARIGAFLGWSGESPDGLRARLSDPGMLSAVLEFVLLDEPMLIEACQALDYPPETPMMALQALPGGETIHWT